MEEGQQDRLLEVDQVVVIVDLQLPQALWPVRKVTYTSPEVDGHVRTAESKLRITYKFALLPV